MAADSELAAPTRSWTACPPLGIARAEPLADGLWQPQRDGTPVDVLPLFELDREGRLACLDILAWPPGRPARVWQRTGTVARLNDAAFEESEFRREPLRLNRTPASWWAGGGTGHCILALLQKPAARPADDPWMPAWRVLEQVPCVVCDDEAHAREVYMLTRRPVRRTLPKIGVAI